jgi:hypothetical protein
MVVIVFVAIDVAIIKFIINHCKTKNNKNNDNQEFAPENDDEKQKSSIEFRNNSQ